MKIVILLMEQNKQLIPDITKYVSNKFGITESLDISIKNLIRLPRNEHGYTVDHLGECIVITDYYGVIGANVKRVDDVNDVSSLAEIIASNFISPKVYFTDDLTVAKRWLDKFDKNYPIIACDFEANDLSLPQFNELTMITIGWSYTTSVVFVFNTKEMENLLLDWLVTTDIIQVWHNALFDLSHVFYRKHKLPKNIEDSQLLAAVYNNNVDVLKRKSGLKGISGVLYGKWAEAKSTFELYDTTLNTTVTDLIYRGTNTDTDKYNLALIKYCGIDACATKYAYCKYNTEVAHPSEWIQTTSEPRYNTEEFNQRYYYEFVLKASIKPVIRMLANGQHINMDKVESLKQQTESMKERLTKELDNDPLIRPFQAQLDKERINKFIEPVQRALKVPKYAGYKNTVKMRTFVVNYWDKSNHEALKATELKSIDTEIAHLLIDKQFDHHMVIEASNAYEEEECLRQNTNAGRIDKLTHPENYVDIGFNPFNYSQLTKLWQHIGLTSTEVSKKTGEMSFSKDILEDIAKTTNNEAIRDVLFKYLEIASAKMIITTYIPRYIGSTVNDRVYSAIKLMGTVSGRLSGSAGKMKGPNKDKVGINAVTQPSSSSAFAKPVKELFIAAPGKILCAIDYNALEDRVIAILSHDKTKLDITINGLDGHSVATCFYWPNRVRELGLEPSDPASFFEETNTNKAAKTLRQNSKPISFKLAYGGFPDSHKGGTITQEIFDAYHGEMYPGITNYREDYAVPSASSTNYLHLAWGLRLYSSSPDKDIRTLFNALSQGYSCLTSIALNKFDQYILDNNLSERIAITNEIHDAIYLEIDNNVETIKLVNDILPALMSEQFVIDQEIPLGAELDIGYDLYNVTTIKNNASIEDIEETLNKLRK